MRRLRGRVALLSAVAFSVCLGSGLAGLASAPSAAADPCVQVSCATGGGGHFETVAVSITGPAAGAGGGGGGTVQASVPVICWWFNESTNGVTRTIAQLAAADEFQTPEREGANDKYWKNPPPEWWKPYIQAEAAGAQLTAYEPTCEDGNSYSGGDLTRLDAYGLASSPYGLVIGAPGSQPPPVVDPLGLVQIAYDHLDLAKPAVDHNPTILAIGGGTLVGLPTYFWVRDPLSVGGGDGKLWIRATAAGVWAQVNVDNQGITLASPAGAGECSRAQALATGAGDGNRCTVVFEHASTGYSGGFPVSAVATWKASYQTSDGRGGDMPPATVVQPGQLVPVAESQALVNASR